MPPTMLRTIHTFSEDTFRQSLPQFDEPTLRATIQAITLLNYDSNGDIEKTL